MIHPRFEESVTIEVDDQGMVVLICPVDSRHRFKGIVDEQRISGPGRPEQPVATQTRTVLVSLLRSSVRAARLGPVSGRPC